MSGLVETLALPVIRFATRSYIPGPHLSDAMELAHAAVAHDLDITIGYWSEGEDEPSYVADLYRQAIDAMQESGFRGCLAVKLPSLWDRLELVVDVVDYARTKDVRVIFDSHAPEKTDMTFAAIEATGPEKVGLAIPGRWRRSLADLDRAISLGVGIRVVKGQWPDPEEPGMDMREGFMRIIERAAGAAVHVGVATHDHALARRAFACLKKAHTPFEHELVFPLPVELAMREARAAGVKSRLYIPFGSAWLPYSISRAHKNPGMLFLFARDLFTNKRFKLPKRAR